jgi:hypothetical protein
MSSLIKSMREMAIRPDRFTFTERELTLTGAADLIEQQAARIEALEAQLATVAPAVDAQPVAWLVTGGKTFVDRAFITEANADKSIAERKDGAHKVPLGRIDASAQSEGLRKDAIRREALEEIAATLRKGGARVPVEAKGSIESAVQTGLSIALSIVEGALSQKESP